MTTTASEASRSADPADPADSADALHLRSTMRPSDRLLQWLRSHAALLALIGLVIVAAVNLHYRGITWGDDFALYLRQADAVFEGNIGEVIADNHFNVDNAARPGFSQYVYPWGFPLLISPFLRLFGLDYGQLKLFEVACWCVFVWFFHAVVRRRLPAAAAFAVTAAVATSLVYLQHTNSLLSEFPYMASAAVTLWYLDRVRAVGALHRATRGQLVTIGLAAVWVFNVRREGVAMIAAVAVAMAADVVRSRRADEGIDRRAVATPFVAFVGGVIGFQLLLPSALSTKLEDAGFHQTWKKLTGPYHQAFADQLGFPSLRGSWLFAVFALVVAGAVWRVITAARHDAHVLVFAVASMAVAGTVPAFSDRYLMPITPFAVYFAAQALAAVADPPRRLIGTRVPTALLCVVAMGAVTVHHLTRLPSQIDAVQRSVDAGRVVDGPAAPYALNAFAAVSTYTQEGDVVAFFKARALTFYTGRRAVQSSELDVVRQRADFSMMRRNSTFSQALVTDEQAAELGWTEVWSDADWVLWRIPPYTADATAD